jgi:hypothetical protein
MRRSFLLALFAASCVVPQAPAGGSDSLRASVEKDLPKYLRDSGSGVAFVYCARAGELAATVDAAMRSVGDGCDAALTVALSRLGPVREIDPVVADGTTVGFIVRYDIQGVVPITPIEPVPVPEPSTQPTPAPAPNPY